MTIGLVGRKSGMTRVFTEQGVSVPVTVIEVEPNRIAQVKSLETDGYAAIQVTTGAKKASRLAKSEQGHFAKAEVEAGVEALREALAGDDIEAISEKSAALSQSMMKMGEAAYHADGEQADPNSASTDNSDETVVDAEFEEVDSDDDKKSKP